MFASTDPRSNCDLQDPNPFDESSGIQSCDGAVAGPGNVIRLTVAAHGYTGTPTIWAEYLNGVTNVACQFVGTTRQRSSMSNTLDLTAPSSAELMSQSGLVALAAAPAANINLQSQFHQLPGLRRTHLRNYRWSWSNGRWTRARCFHHRRNGQLHQYRYRICQCCRPAPRRGHRGNPVRVAARALTAAYASVATAMWLISWQRFRSASHTTLANPELEWRSLAQPVVNHNTDIVLASGCRSWPSSIRLLDAVIQQLCGRNGNRSQRWSHYHLARICQPTLLCRRSFLRIPLRTTANAALNFACITTAAAVYINAQGYTAP